MTTPDSRPSRQFAMIGLAAAGALIALIVVWRFHGQAREWLNPNALAERIRQFDPYDQVAYVVFGAVGMVVLFPDTVFNLVGAVVYGPWIGTVLAWIAVVIGATVDFWIARGLGRDTVVGMLGDRVRSADAVFGRNGFWGVFFVRLIPVAPFSVISYMAGLTAVKFRDYLIATAIVTLPMNFAHQYIFSKINDALTRGGSAHHSLHLANAALLAIGLALIAVISPRIARRLQSPKR